MSDNKTPAPPTLGQVQAENGLVYEIWRVALDEACSAKDAQRRMDALAGLSQAQVVEAYFSEHPEMKRWADAHIAAGTCEPAIYELRAALGRTQELRAKQREAITAWAAKPLEERCEPPPEGVADWMKPFMLGPAKFPEPVVLDPEFNSALLPTVPRDEAIKNRGGDHQVTIGPHSIRR